MEVDSSKNVPANQGPKHRQQSAIVKHYLALYNLVQFFG